MVWQKTDYMERIRAFLMSYPDFESLESAEDASSDRLVIEYSKTTPRNAINPEGYAFSTVGTNIISREEDILGNVILRKRANFIFLIKRYTQINEARQELGDLVLNLFDWINTENELRTNPKLPNFSDTLYNQIIADGGLEIGSEETSQGIIDLFQISIHLEWEKEYTIEY